MRTTTVEQLQNLQQKPRCVRNVCVLAHVDHGKTSLVDSLVASNGIISTAMAGKLRYMDSRPDEQQRGITMKSSAIALKYNFGMKTIKKIHIYLNQCKNYYSGGEDVLINVIDSPGHVDFSSEVSTAVRLCDGAIVVVDVVEGVCPQTKVCIQQAWTENLKPVLVLNKVDRLVSEMKLQPLDAYVHLTQVLEQINAVMGELFASEAISNTTDTWTSGLDEADDSQLYFSPEQGNVVFASAVDGWAFDVAHFAGLFSAKLNLDKDELAKCLWGDFYLKGGKIATGAQEKAKKPLFVQLVLENLWAVYESRDKEKIKTMAEKLGVKMSARDARHPDPKVQIRALLAQWMPLASAVLEMICKQVPSPAELSDARAVGLMSSQHHTFECLPEESKSLKKDFLDCKSTDEAPVILYISKMIPVDKSTLPENKPKPLTAEEIARRKLLAREKHAQMMAQAEAGMHCTSLDERPPDPKKEEEQMEEMPGDDLVFVAFARVFSGTVKIGQSLYVLNPKHDPQEAIKKLNAGEELGPHIHPVEVRQLYILMGRDLEAVDFVPAGNVLGIGGLEEQVLKSATLASTVACPAFTELQQAAEPILRVAVEPRHPQQMPQLLRGLKLLNQADACVQVLVQESGEHVIVTVGEVHLQRCIDDLKTRYAKIEMNVSEPIVQFRETIIDPPKMDMVNEAIIDTTKIGENAVEVWTSNRQAYLKVLAVALPSEVATLLENNRQQLRQDPSKVKDQLKKAFASENWPEDTVDRIWTFGPRRCGPNILLNRIEGHPGSIWTEEGPNGGSFVNGFQLATLAGPLCEEPMMGICFVVQEFIEEGEVVTGQLMSAVKEACRKAFQAQPQRLMLAMYTCNILANADILGRSVAGEQATIGRRLLEPERRVAWRHIHQQKGLGRCLGQRNEAT
ncbi:elongation factor-like GTPase 1 isoform X3 [Neocloeon triangulifer]|uniref:elongation factor-like GTPase 1 isoform X3 n=1 Tax=Neocloeon triangulifer TaxID=2078957 RepID=UPI00286FA210|nr:elongation factor-like GTPase 1 isoform X3 [Neocloeon triangulifer]